MKKMNKKKILLLIAVILLIVLSGCTENVDANGDILPSRLITKETTFSEIFANDSWFGSLIVYPVAQVMNYVTPYLGVAGGIAVATIGINLLVLPFSLKSSIGLQKIQMVQPELNKIQKKYEGKTDDRSKMAQSTEMMALYKKHNISPFSSIFGQFATLPIILSIFQAVQRAESVVYGSFMTMDLALTPLEGIQAGNMMYVAMFVAMAAAQLLSMKLPSVLAKRKLKEDHRIKSYDKDANKKGQNENMIYIMWAVIVVISLSWSTAMSVYWFISALVTLVKSLYVQHVISKSNTGEN